MEERTEIKFYCLGPDQFELCEVSYEEYGEFYTPKGIFTGKEMSRLNDLKLRHTFVNKLMQNMECLDLLDFD